MSKANQKVRLPSVSQGIFNVLEQSIVERRQARELYRSRKKQATRIYREEARSTLSNASLVSLYGSRVPIKDGVI